MRRKLFTLAAGVSAALCAGVCVLWVRSYWATDCLQYVTSTDLTAILSTRGNFLLRSDTMSGAFFAPEAVTTYYWSTRPPEDAAGYRPPRTWSEWSWAGVRVQSGAWQWVSRRVIIVPAWMVLLVTAILPFLWMRVYLRDRPRPNNVCPCCGYDLRATPDRCPECGAVPVKGTT